MYPADLPQSDIIRLDLHLFHVFILNLMLSDFFFVMRKKTKI